MVDIADSAVANRFVSGYDLSGSAPNFERMIAFHLHAACDWKGTRP